jgi:Protein of unknown function (DUF1320).
MSKFITKEDYGASIHAEILDAVTRSDNNIIEICENRAIKEMRGFLSQRYNCDVMFSAAGADRNDLVLMMAIDIAVYHIFSAHNPRNMSKIREERYKRAIEWLKRVRDGKEIIDGVMGLSDEDKELKSEYLIKSNPKRTTHF